MRFEIIKCHGSGNDFVLIDARTLDLSDADWASVARAVSDRAGPIGSDGLLLLTAGDKSAVCGMIMRNSDGSQAETCLNGLRCVARLGFERLGINAANVRLQTSQAQVARAADLAEGVYTVAETAGPVDLAAAGWVRAGSERYIEAAIPGLPSARTFTAVKMPNPHLIAFVEAIDDGELAVLGAFCETAPPLLPERANVSFVAVRGPGRLFVRTCERGVGLTDSCGSAMAAATYAAALTNRIRFDDAVTVLNRGGRVIARASRGAMITIHGNATWEWAGSVSIDLATAVADEPVVATRFDAEAAAWQLVADAKQNV